MKCKECFSESKVTHTRQEGVFIRRRRKCTNCTHSWVTYEIPRDICATLVKNQPKKYRSCCKCNRVRVAWKFCLEHLKEYKRLDMRARRDFWKQHGTKMPKKKKGSKRI